MLLDVADNGQISSLDLTAEKLQQWVNEVKTKTTPAMLPETEVVTLDGKTVTTLRVKEYSIKPVGVKGRYYRRVGNANHLMTPDEVAQAHYKTFKEYGLAAQEFAEVGNSFLVTAYKKRISGFIQGAPAESEGNTREKILEVIKANPEITTQELATSLLLSVKGVEWNLKGLKAAGLLKRIGADKGGHWEVIAQ